MSYQRTVDEVGVLRDVAVTSRESRALYADYRAQKTFGSLDALRALSILAVLWHHALLVPSWVHQWVPAANFGFLGVDLFFVLSGFLIVTLLLREREQRGEISLKHFYLRRSLRIFPLYYGMLAGFALLFFVLRPDGSGAQAFRADLPFLLLYLTNWVFAHGMVNMTWSLAAEEQFYLCWPPIERFLRGYAVPVVVSVIVVSELIQFGALDAPLAAWFGIGPDEPRMLREVTFAPICLGVLLAHALHHRSSFERVAWLLGKRAAAPLLLAGIALSCQLCSDDLKGIQRLVMHLMMTALVAAVVVREDHGLCRLARLRPLARVGALSYGIYLLHMPVFGFVNAALLRLGLQWAFADFVLGTLLVVAAAELSFRFYEAPFLRLKQRFS